MLDVEVRVLLKIAATIALLWCLWELSGIILLLAVAVIWAVALDGPVSWLEERGVSRAAASLLITGLILTAAVTFVWQTWSSLTSQWQYLTAQLEQRARETAAYVPAWLYPGAGNTDLPATLQAFVIEAGRSIATALTLVVLGYFVTIYLLIDGRRTLAWVVAFFPLRLRDKVALTVAESRDAIRAYTRGNVITSAFATTWVLIWMMVLHVPAALLLAVIAGLADFVPVLGFIASAVTADRKSVDDIAAHRDRHAGLVGRVSHNRELPDCAVGVRAEPAALGPGDRAGVRGGRGIGGRDRGVDRTAHCGVVSDDRTHLAARAAAERDGDGTPRPRPEVRLRARS